MINLTKELMKYGVTRYQIAKKLGTSWNTVEFWNKEIWEPSPKYRRKLGELLEKTKEKADIKQTKIINYGIELLKEPQ